MGEQSMLKVSEAWQEYKPKPGHWDHAAVAHFHRRAGFGATSDEIAAGLKLTPGELIDQLLSAVEDPEQAREFDFVTKASLRSNDIETLSASWLMRMLHTRDVLREKMTLFWHGHFATSNEKVQNAKLMHQQNQLLREQATGDFRKLVHGIAKNPAMLIYLDSESNRKSHPNENFAREIMELFVLGEGNYTEQDVRELSRCFTGWELRRDRYRFNRYQHDPGEKSVLGTTGPLTGEQGVDVVLGSDAGPRFIVRKLVQYFVCDEPELVDEYIEPLAKQLRDDDWNVHGVLRTILSSRMFYSPTAVARKIRSPIDLAVGLLRTLEASCNLTQLGNDLRPLGQQVFHPPNVKGWDGGRTWINSSTLLGRANFVRNLLGEEKTRFAGKSLEKLVSKHAKRETIEWLEKMLLATPLLPNVRRELDQLLTSKEGTTEDRLRRVVHAISIQPQFQLG